MRTKLFTCRSVALEVILALVLFVYAVLTETIVKTIIDILYFIIILELVRMVVEYIKSPTHRVKLRYLVDAGIIAVLREIIIIVVDKHSLNQNLLPLKVYAVSVFVLIALRYTVMKITPNEYESEYKKEF
jgi:uncharacterized membrane protein (DUF373 family)